MRTIKTSSSLNKNSENPLILLFSTRDRIRDILTVGLVQCDYQIIQAEASYLATIKAYQFIPDLIIADITANNTKDILMVPRLKKSIRTRGINILLILQRDVQPIVDKFFLENHTDPLKDQIHVIEYPFSFADLQNKVRAILSTASTSHAKQGPLSTRDTDALQLQIAGRLYDLQISVAAKLKDVESVMHKQWAFPFTVIKALDIIESDASCCAELGKCVATDEGASAAILKVANTVLYAKRGKAVSDITDAVMRVGFRETRNLLSCLALIDLSPDTEKKYGFSRQEFWLHSLATGLIAEKLCADAGHRRPELAFVAGLVHDLGKIPIDNNFNLVFSRLLEETANNASLFFETEEKLIGFSHAELGHYLANRWNFPSAIALAILNHHSAEKIAATQTPIDRIVQESVYAANILAKTLGLGHSCDEFIDEIPQAMLNELKIPQGPNEAFFTSILRSLKKLCEFLHLSTSDLTLGRAYHEGESIEIVIVYSKSIAFHPLALALQNCGYHVRTTDRFSPELHSRAQVVISISEKGYPLDIMLFEDDREVSPTPALLKMFLVDIVPTEDLTGNFSSGDIVFMNRTKLNMRLVLHTLDQFIGKIAVPEKIELPAEPVPEPPRALIFKAKD